jgi:hypothetical protein
MKTRIAALGCALVVVLSLAAPARAEEPPFVDWSSLLPASPGFGYEPTSADECRSGKIQCVDKVIREMTKRFDRLAVACDHDAVFALTYLRTTEEYRRAALTPGFFVDTPFVNHEDVVFAAYYLDAYDAWHRGDRADVPGAWRVAFEAADQRQVSASGNVFLGMSAHINRDLPYVLAAIGLVAPDGSSRKTDHDSVNRFLNRVSEHLFPEIARRFDPSATQTRQIPGWVDDTASFQIVPTWREAAWRNAERLVAAKTPSERAAVEASIEASATAAAIALRDATAYNPLLGQSSAARDAHCAVHHAGP